MDPGEAPSVREGATDADSDTDEATSVSEGALSLTPAPSIRCRIPKKAPTQIPTPQKPIPTISRLMAFVRTSQLTNANQRGPNLADGTSQAHTGYTNCNDGRASSRSIANNHVHTGFFSRFYILRSCGRCRSQSIHRGNGGRSGRGSSGSASAARRPSQRNGAAKAVSNPRTAADCQSAARSGRGAGNARSRYSGQRIHRQHS